MINKKWQLIFNNLNILNEIKDKGYYLIKRENIVNISRNRFMIEWKTLEEVPDIFKINNLDLLYLGNHNYMIASFNLRASVPSDEGHKYTIDTTLFSFFESFKINHSSTSEDILLYLDIAEVINSFNKGKSSYLTKRFIEHRHSYSFKQEINQKNYRIKANNVKFQVHGLFESEELITVVIILDESLDNILLSTLYYPYIFFKEKFQKQTKFLVVQYSDMVIKINEFKFAELDRLNSLEWIEVKKSSSSENKIFFEDLKFLLKEVPVKTDDNMNDTDIPFIQANSFENIISMLKYLHDEGSQSNSRDLAVFLDISERQVGYYYNAGRYLKLFTKSDKENFYSLSSLGQEIITLDYRNQHLRLISQILEHKIFNDIFSKIVYDNTFPSQDTIRKLMVKYNVMNKSSTINRRAQSVLAWVKWVLDLIDESSYEDKVY